MSYEVDGLPDGWRRVALSSVTQDVPHQDPSRQPDQVFTYIDIGAIDNQTFTVVQPKRLLGREAPSRARRPVMEGDVIFSNVRTYLRNVAQIESTHGTTIASTGFTILRPTRELSSRYLFHLVRSDYFIDRVTPEQTGTQYPATSDRVVRGQQIPLPPLPIQEQIAKLIDDVEGSRQHSGHALRKALRIIERFRQSILATACTGGLTADWREKNPDSSTVEQALDARRGVRRQRQSHEAAVDLPLPELPDSYFVSSVGDAAVLLEYGTSERADASAEAGIPVLRMGNIQDGRLNLRDLKYRRLDRELQGLLLEDGDLLFNRTNSPELVGKCAVFHGTQPTSFASYLIRVRFSSDVALPDFVNYWINSAWGRVWASLAKTDGVSQSNINGSKLALMPLPLPPVEEQRVIVERASRMLETSEQLAKRVERAIKQVERSSQAVLTKAFRGELREAR